MPPSSRSSRGREARLTDPVLVVISVWTRRFRPVGRRRNCGVCVPHANRSAFLHGRLCPLRGYPPLVIRQRAARHGRSFAHLRIYHIALNSGSPTSGICRWRAKEKRCVMLDAALRVSALPSLRAE